MASAASNPSPVLLLPSNPLGLWWLTRISPRMPSPWHNGVMAPLPHRNSPGQVSSLLFGFAKFASLHLTHHPFSPFAFKGSWDRGAAWIEQYCQRHGIMEPWSHCPVHNRGGADPPGEGEGKRLRALWELGRGERERKLRLDANESSAWRGSSSARRRGERSSP